MVHAEPEHFRGQGIITQSCRKFMSYLHHSFGLEHFEIHAAVGNDSSERVAERLEFQLSRINKKRRK